MAHGRMWTGEALADGALQPPPPSPKLRGSVGAGDTRWTGFTCAFVYSFCASMGNRSNYGQKPLSTLSRLDALLRCRHLPQNDPLHLSGSSILQSTLACLVRANWGRPCMEKCRESLSSSALLLNLLLLMENSTKARQQCEIPSWH